MTLKLGNFEAKMLIFQINKTENIFLNAEQSNR